MATRKSKVAFKVKRFKNVMRQIGQSKRGTFGTAIIVFFVVLAIFAPWIAPYDPIEPWRDIGEYPAYDSPPGPKIAEKLCYPYWYKYLPWVYKGPIETKEVFLNTRTFIEELNRTFNDIESINLGKRVADIREVKAIFPNGSWKKLAPEEWSWDPKKLKKVTLACDVAEALPNMTQVEVTYLTGSDITETMSLVTDYKFSSNEAFYSKWESRTSHPELFNVTYNSQKGFENDGCVEIKYSGSKSNVSDGKVNATLLMPFEYPYWSPPTSFAVHFSACVEASVKTNVTITLLLYNEALDETFIVTRRRLSSTGTYLHYRDVSTGNETIQTIGLYAEQIIFPKPANMSFGLNVDFADKEKDVTVYIDNLQCILYGNSFGLLGTDNGSPFPPRDIFSTLVWGTRVSLIVGVLSALFSTLIGLFVGLIAGYVGGIADESLMRLADLLLVLPTLPLFIVLIAVMKTTYGLVSMWNIIILLTFFGWMSFSRSVRSMVLSIRERPFVEAAKAAGGGKFYIITKHMIPNVFPLVYVTLATAVPGAIITEASLSWLGLGDPSIPSWGKVLYDFNVSGIAVTKGLIDYWFWIFPPCISIALLATAFILLGFALDEILNPRLRKRR